MSDLEVLKVFLIGVLTGASLQIFKNFFIK